MQKTVTFLSCQPTRNFNNDDLECTLKFSVLDSSLIGTPTERESIHILKVIVSDMLLINWQLLRTLNPSVITEDMVKVAFQRAEEHITEQIRKGGTTGKEWPILSMTTNNSPGSCPYNLSNIQYPIQTHFTVDIDDQTLNQEQVRVHTNIQVLLDRMEESLRRDDYSNVLHASASTFETMAKDIVSTLTVEEQT